MAQWSKVVWLALILLGGLACKGVDNPALKTVAPATLQAGWANHDISEDGFTIAAPTNWTTNPNERMNFGMEGEPMVPIENLPADIQKLDQQVKQHEAEEEERYRRKHKKAGIALMLYDKSARSIPGEERTRLWIKVKEGAGTLKDEASDMKQGLTGASTVEQKHVELPVGPAEAFMTSQQTQGGDTVTEIVYLLVGGNKCYTVRFLSTNSPERITLVSSPIMETFRVK